MSGPGLGAAVSATRLVPGDPGALRAGAGLLDDFAVELDEAAGVVGAARAVEWTGAAADVWRAARKEQPGRLRDAANAFSYAAAALRSYADVVEEAQGDASRAIGLWADGERATAAWRAQQAQAQAAGVRVGGGGVWDLPAGSREDPGLEDRQRAQRVLGSALDNVASEAGLTAKKLRDAAAEAPSKPAWYARAWHDTVGVAEGAWHGAEGAGKWAYHHAPQLRDATLHAGEMVIGAATFAIGATAEGGGFVLDATGAGTVVGVPLNAVGGLAMGGGAALAGYGADSLDHDIHNLATQTSETDGAASAGDAAAEQDAAAQAATEDEAETIEAAEGSLQIIGEGFSDSELYAARTLAAKGRTVVLRQATGVGRTSDLLVDGVPYDVYTPTTSSLDNIVGAIARKGTQVNGGGVVLDLSSSPLTNVDRDALLARVRGVTNNVSDIIILGG